MYRCRRQLLKGFDDATISDVRVYRPSFVLLKNFFKLIFDDFTRGFSFWEVFFPQTWDRSFIYYTVNFFFLFFFFSFFISSQLIVWLMVFYTDLISCFEKLYKMQMLCFLGFFFLLQRILFFFFSCSLYTWLLLFLLLLIQKKCKTNKKSLILTIKGFSSKEFPRSRSVMIRNLRSFAEARIPSGSPLNAESERWEIVRKMMKKRSENKI